MKKAVFIMLFMACCMCLFGCSSKDSVRVVNTIDGSFRTYSELSDGTWQCEGQRYKYRLEIRGRMNNAAVDSIFVYLSNLEDISFDRAWKASGLSSDTSDYFSEEEAVFVDWIPDKQIRSGGHIFQKG